MTEVRHDGIGDLEPIVGDQAIELLQGREPLVV
jgi:hypothetical protein